MSGFIDGIRFYKGAGNNGTHIGSLYDRAGDLLAQATFTGETASGWQQANFSAPVEIAANTTYVAAYFSTTGFAYDSGYLTSAGVDNPPLHAPENGVDGSNGVYAYGSAAQFPSSSYNSTNYWADVAFTPLAPDLTIGLSHSGSFAPGETGATYAMVASNIGNAPTTGLVTVTEAVPTWLTATSMQGSGWTCTQPAGPCTRSDALGAGSSYPQILPTVNVASNAGSSVTNVAAVAGGGETNTGNDVASDPTGIQTAANTIFAASAVPGTP